MNSLTIVWNALPFMLEGSLVTIANVVLSLAIGFFMGIPMAIGQCYGCTLVRRIVGVYVWFFRGIPVLVLLFLFFGLFVCLGIPPQPFTLGCIVLGLTSAAYQSQIFRGSVQSVSSGQLKAARALGMSDAAAIRCIILPQMLRISIPGWANEFSILLKDSAICYVLGTQEIMARTNFVAARTHEHLALFAMAGLLYFLITAAGLFLLKRLENRMRIPGYSA